jgi:hypothetical protein
MKSKKMTLKLLKENQHFFQNPKYIQAVSLQLTKIKETLNLIRLLAIQLEITQLKIKAFSNPKTQNPRFK